MMTTEQVLRQIAAMALEEANRLAGTPTPVQPPIVPPVQPSVPPVTVPSSSGGLTHDQWLDLPPSTRGFYPEPGVARPVPSPSTAPSTAPNSGFAPIGTVPTEWEYKDFHVRLLGGYPYRFHAPPGRGFDVNSTNAGVRFNPPDGPVGGISVKADSTGWAGFTVDTDCEAWMKPQ